MPASKMAFRSSSRTGSGRKLRMLRRSFKNFSVSFMLVAPFLKCSGASPGAFFILRLLYHAFFKSPTVISPKCSPGRFFYGSDRCLHFNH